MADSVSSNGSSTLSVFSYNASTTPKAAGVIGIPRIFTTIHASQGKGTGIFLCRSSRAI